MIDVAVFPKFGNLTKGSGLSAVFDGTPGTTAYAEGPLGWAGVSFAGSPKRIGRAEIVSATNGFDASGATTAISLELRAKNGAPPVLPGDGVWLGGGQWFTDVNQQLTKEVISLDLTTEWDHVWWMIKSGVWTVAAEVRFFEPDGQQDLQLIDTPHSHTLRNSCNERIKLNYGVVELWPIRIAFELPEKRVVSHDFHGDFIHKGKSYNGTQDFIGVVGVGCHIVRRYSPTREGLASAAWIQDENEVGGGNILDVQQHYINKSIVGGVELDAGFHEYSIWAGCHTDLLPLNTTSHLGVVEVLAEGANAPYKGRNLLRVKIEPLGSKLTKF